MLTDWINVQGVKITGAERLYPNGLNWEIKPGVNAIIGGTGLGKTTLVYALQFGVFGKMIVENYERIERDFFKDRLTNRSEKQTKATPAAIEVKFAVGKSVFIIRRNLLNGLFIEASCDGKPIKGAKYEEMLAEKVGLTKDFPSFARLQGHLFFAGEGRFLIAWENLIQNELLNLMFSSHETYSRLNALWDRIESLDSEARNLSAQSYRIEKNLEAIDKTSPKVKELERRRDHGEIINSRKKCEGLVESLQAGLEKERRLLRLQDDEVTLAHDDFHRSLAQFESDSSNDFDADLVKSSIATPTIFSVRKSLEQFYLQPNICTCPSCGRPGMAGDLKIMVEIADASAKGNNCIICRKELSQPTRPPEAALAGGSETTGPSPKRLQEILFKREQTKSRIENLQIELRNAYIDLTDVRAAEIKFLQENPTGTVVPLRAAAKELRKRESLAIGEREKQIKVLRKELASSNTVFEGIQAKMAKAFRKYAALYLDEPCDVEFLNEERLPGRHGPQIKAPHAAFFPIVSGQTRPSSQTLSDAQRSFVDLAFRMAVLEVWHQQTGKTATMIIETPEGAVDIAYMGRVASMLRTFGNQGHTLIITTNLNNDIFLPEIMCAIPKPQRLSRILNLLNHGRPRKVQQTHMKQFNKILDAVSNHPFEL